MVTVDDIAAAVKNRCAGSAAFVAAVPGGAYFERPDEDAAAPYAVFGIDRAGDPEFDSGGGYTQAFTLRMAVYSVVGTSDPQAAQLGMADALNTNPTDWAALRAGKVMHGLPRGYDGKFDPKLRNSADVFVSAAQWALLVEGNLEA